MRRLAVYLGTGAFGWWWGLGSGAGPLVSALLFISFAHLLWLRRRP